MLNINIGKLLLLSITYGYLKLILAIFLAIVLTIFLFVFSHSDGMI